MRRSGVVGLRDTDDRRRFGSEPRAVRLRRHTHECGGFHTRVLIMESSRLDDGRAVVLSVQYVTVKLVTSQ